MSTQEAQTTTNPRIHIPSGPEIVSPLPQVNLGSMRYLGEVSLTVAHAQRGINTLLVGIDNDQAADCAVEVKEFADVTHDGRIQSIIINQNAIQEHCIDQVNTRIRDVRENDDENPRILVLLPDLNKMIGSGAVKPSADEDYAIDQITNWSVGIPDVGVGALVPDLEGHMHPRRVELLEHFKTLQVVRR